MPLQQFIYLMLNNHVNDEIVYFILSKKIRAMNSSKPLYNHLLLLAITCLCTSFLCRQPTPAKGQTQVKNRVEENKKSGFAVVELFTSEGCSSCPPADELVSEVVSEKHENIYVLAYHVDYWNRLGWKDVFSKPEWSARQQYYAAMLGREGVYTPQIVVNGKQEFVGSNETKLRNAISNEGKEPSALLTLSTTKISDELLQISYETEVKNSNVLHIALVQPDATTDVKRGENEGRKLHHVNIVRDLITTEIITNKGSLKITIPKELINVPLILVGFIQQKQDGKIIAAAQSGF